MKRSAFILAGLFFALASTSFADGVGGTVAGSNTTGILSAIGLFLVLEPLVLYLTFKPWFDNPNMPAPPSPERFFHGAIYSFGAMIVTGAVVTFFFAQVDMANTPLMHFWGYNNVCVVFDNPPATYICPVYWFFIGYLLVRYAFEDTKRLMTLATVSPMEKRLGYAINIGLVLASAFFSLCLAIRPENDMYGHTLPFVVLMIFFPATSLMHCWLRPQRTALHVAFVSAYVLFSAIKVTFDLYGLITRTHVPVSWAHPVDVLWTLCAISAPFLIPPPVDQPEAAAAMDGALKAGA